MADDTDAIRARLLRIEQKTKSATNIQPAGWWVGDRAGERRVHDDVRAGRIVWRSAHNCAKRGLAALEAGDFDLATLYAWEATSHYMDALEAQLGRIRASDRGGLDRSAKPRGRPKKN